MGTVVGEAMEQSYPWGLSAARKRGAVANGVAWKRFMEWVLRSIL